MGNEVDLLLDYGNSIVSVEMKAGGTLSGDYFKGLQFYSQLSGEKNTKKMVVYGGEQSMRYHDVDVYSYHQLPELFATLNAEY